MERWRSIQLSASLGLAATLIVTTASAQDLLPNLEPFAASEVRLTDGGNTLRFSTTTWNKGAGPMEIAGGEVGTTGQNVYQRIYQVTGGGFREVLAGTFDYHGGTHNHFHLEDYALYTLQPVDSPITAQGEKVSFCLLDNTKINTRLSNSPKKAQYTTCNPQVQGISVGWGDTYRYHLDGQSLDFTSHPSGDYLLKIEVNPLRHLVESDYTDNVSCALLRVDRNAFSVQVIGTSCNPVSTPPVTVGSISNNYVNAGSSTAVTISGSGFTSNLNVYFDRGAGKTPVASNVVVVNEWTIQATVSVGTGGSPSDPVWDLHVGSAVLPDAFTVIR